MNILFVNETPFNPTYGGIERVTDLLVREFLQYPNFEVFYLCARVDEPRMMEYDFPALQLVLPEAGGFSNNENINFYKSLLKKYKINIVVNQRGWAPFMNKVLGLEGVKTISVIHTVPRGWQLSYLNGILRYDKNWNGYWRYLLKLIIYPFYLYYKKYKSSLFLKSHYRCLVSSSSAIVLLSNQYRLELNRLLPRKMQKCHTFSIPNPTDVYDNLPKEGDKKKVILYVARLSDTEKKPIRMLKIWKRLYNKHKDWRLVIVGDGDAYDSLIQFVKRNKLSRVHFEGKQKDVSRYYQQASFICLTSNFEGWGMTLTEGMSRGCIPVTFDNYGAANDIIDDRINGCLIPSFDLRTYANRISELILDDNMRTSMSNEAFKKVRRFSVGLVARSWMELFYFIENN